MFQLYVTALDRNVSVWERLSTHIFPDNIYGIRSTGKRANMILVARVPMTAPTIDIFSVQYT